MVISNCAGLVKGEEHATQRVGPKANRMAVPEQPCGASALLSSSSFFLLLECLFHQDAGFGAARLRPGTSDLAHESSRTP
jgi:hypothetical protein